MEPVRLGSNPPKRSRTDVPVASIINQNFTTPNPFAALSNSEDINDDITDATPQNKDLAPPPIMVNMINFEAGRSALIQLIGNNFTCSVSTKHVTIRTTSPADYRKVVKYLQEANAEYHTYQLKDDKAFRVVLRGLHPSTPVQLLKEEIESKNHKVRSIVNVISKHKIPTPLFFLDLEPDANNKDIFNLSSLLNCKIKVEEPRIKHAIPQCVRCQSFAHTKAYCYHPPRCVKCGGSHLTSDCVKPREEQAKCANCGENHPANYRGCSVYQQLQRQRQRNTFGSHRTSFLRPQRENTTDRVPVINDQTFPPLHNNRDPRMKNIHHQQRPNLQGTEHPQVDGQLQQLNKQQQQLQQQQQQQHQLSYQQQERQHYQQTYSAAARSQASGKHYSNDNFPQSIDGYMSSFINEIKSLIMPLMTLITQLTQVLLAKNV
jgi:hypothetical protein